MQEIGKQNSAEMLHKIPIIIKILTNVKFCSSGNLATSTVADNALIASFIQLLNTWNF